jgi:hypothetical protein
LFAAALGAWVVAIAFSRAAGAPLVAAGSLFFAASIALAVVDRVRDTLPIGSPRAIGWLLVVLTASFVPLVSISGAWGDESSLLMLPAVGGTLVSWVAVPWLCVAGPQPAWIAGRATPALLAWLGLALNAVLSTT